MSDDEADPELLALLRQHLQSKLSLDSAPDTGVLDSAKFIYDNSIDVAVDMRATKAAAASIRAQMQAREYSTASWAAHELHPRVRVEGEVEVDVKPESEEKQAWDADNALAFIFTVDLLNFSFWSEKPADERFAVEYRGKRWTGYWSLVAALHRALDAGTPITSPDFWQSQDECNMELLREVFKSATDEEMPMLEERLACLREAGQVLYEMYECSIPRLVSSANKSAAALANRLARDFPCFRDEVKSPWPGRSSRKPLRFLKRAQIFAADLWACFGGAGYGEFGDVDKLTMFADYRLPQALATMGCIGYAPALYSAVRSGKVLERGTSWEVQLRGCSIWCVEMIRREILNEHPDTKLNAVLIDFFLYDMTKELEAQGHEMVPHHRTRSIWY